LYGRHISLVGIITGPGLSDWQILRLGRRFGP